MARFVPFTCWTTMAYLQVLLLAALASTTAAKGLNAQCVIERTNSDPEQPIEGVIWLRQASEDAEVTIAVSLTGFDTRDNITQHGFHIHAGDTARDRCAQTLGHYNPYNRLHGPPFGPERHLGDLGNIREISGQVSQVIEDRMVKILGPAPDNVIGKTMVVHYNKDDLGSFGNGAGNAGKKIGCCKIEEVTDDDFIEGMCEMDGETGRGGITGSIYIKQLKKGGMTAFETELDGVFPNGRHGFHVHTNGDTGDQCRAAGGHYNPLGKNHGGPNPTERHIGDLGNVNADTEGKVRMTVYDCVAKLSGPYSIFNRAIVVHEGEDDLGQGGNPGSLATGNAGARLACCVIRPTMTVEAQCVVERSNSDPNQRIGGVIRLRQKEGRSEVHIAAMLDGFDPNDVNTDHGFHVHTGSDASNRCASTGGHYNPFQTVHGGPTDETRHVGDLGNIMEGDNGRVHAIKKDTVISLMGLGDNNIIGRTMVIHEGRDDLTSSGNGAGNAGSKIACCKIEKVADDDLLETMCEMDGSTGQGGVTGTVRMKQPAAGGMMSFDIDLMGITPSPSRKHGFHVHTTGDTGNECRNAGGHYNPMGKSHGGPNAAERHIGDLGNIMVDENGKARMTIFDAHASLQGDNSIWNRAIVVHAGEDDLGLGGNDGSRATGNAGGRLGCCVIKPPVYVEAQCVIESSRNQPIEGVIRLRQELGSNIHIAIDLKGFNKTDGVDEHGFHIHEGTDPSDSCSQTMGHYNPDGTTHGGPQNPIRHLGDLGNIRELDGRVRQIKKDDRVSIIGRGKYNVMGRTMVIHAGRDDLTPSGNGAGNAGSKIACCKIEAVAGDKFMETTCEMDGTTGQGGVTGTVRVRQPSTGGMTSFDIDLKGITPSTSRKHGFHVHVNGDTRNECRNAGGHYNPMSKKHGGPNAAERHVGDLGNIMVDANGNVRTTIYDSHASLQGENNIWNRAIVVHAGEDDLGLANNDGSRATGNAGARLGCCILKPPVYVEAQCVIRSAPNRPIEGVIRLRQQMGGLIRIAVNLQGFDKNDGVEEYGFHIHEGTDASNQCSETKGHYNPFGAKHGGPDSAERHLGDLGNIKEVEGMVNQLIEDRLVSIICDGKNNVMGRTMVIHAGRDDLTSTGNGAGNAGSKLACCKIEEVAPDAIMEATCKMDGTTGMKGVTGTVHMRQLAEGGMTAFDIDLQGIKEGKHGFHVHAVGDTGDQCKNAGGHFNPFNQDHGGPNAAIRHVGDLGNIMVGASGRIQTTIFDPHARLDVDNSIWGKAIVVHAGEDDLGLGGDDGSKKTGNAGARLGCCKISEPMYKEAQCIFNAANSDPDQKVEGVVRLRQMMGSQKVYVIVDLEGFDTFDSIDRHGFHIHAGKDANGRCSRTQGHYNPFSTKHGGPTSSERHVGDLGNIVEGSDGRVRMTMMDSVISLTSSGKNNVMGRTMVIHANMDDLTSTGNGAGNAGGKIACCKIEEVSENDFLETTCDMDGSTGTGDIRGRIHIRQPSSGGMTSFDVSLEGFPGAGEHGFHVHAYGDTGDQCKKAGGHYNPLGRDHGGPGDEQRHIGDLGNIKVGANGRVRTTVYDNLAGLTGRYDIWNRAIVVHAGKDDLGKGGDDGSKKTGNAGARLGCCVIKAPVYMEAQCVVDRDNSDPNQRVEGVIRLRQMEGSKTVEVIVHLKGFDQSDLNSEHGFHVHAGFEAGDRCSQTKGHYNPFSTTHGGPNNNIRHVGDLGNIREQNGEVREIIKDSVISLMGTGRNNVMGRTIVIHARRDDLTLTGNGAGNAGSKIACCKIVKVPEFLQETCTFDGTTGRKGIRGQVYVRQPKAGGLASFDIDLSGFTPSQAGKHGFHVHSVAHTGNECKNAKGHYNPKNKNHGGPNSDDRHVGDLGNIMVGSNGRVRTTIYDHLAVLVGETSIMNRSIVIHAGEDDLGRESNEGSRTTGNAGARLACCVLGHPADIKDGGSGNGGSGNGGSGNGGSGNGGSGNGGGSDARRASPYLFTTFATLVFCLLLNRRM